MKQIKYRAWDRKENVMVNGAMEILNFGLGDGSMVVNSDVQKGNELDWMQFTGKKDKNGKEIYVGDIVKAIGGEDHEDSSKTSDVIQEDMGTFSVREPKEDDIIYTHGLNLWWGGWKSLEVIGSIYENPELLK